MNDTTFASTYALDTSHPNYQRWQRAIDHARLRGETICHILARYVDLHETTVLDAGCGVGGTSVALHAHGADVIAVDCAEDRLAALTAVQPEIETECCDLSDLPYPDASFDVIVLQDVIEHVPSPARVLDELARVLTTRGLLYMSTPNRNAIPNLFADPHFGLPFVARKNRDQLRSVLRKRRPADAERQDLAQLLGYSELWQLLHDHGFTATFVNRHMAQVLFDRPEALVWTDNHLRAVRLLQRSGLRQLALRLVSDEAGFFNSWLNPTWYLICRKDV